VQKNGCGGENRDLSTKSREAVFAVGSLALDGFLGKWDTCWLTFVVYEFRSSAKIHKRGAQEDEFASMLTYFINPTSAGTQFTNEYFTKGIRSIIVSLPSEKRY